MTYDTSQLPQTLTPRAARHVLWHYGLDGGEEPGSFVASLLRTIALADQANRAKMALVFPAYVVGAELVEHTALGAELLQQRGQKEDQ